MIWPAILLLAVQGGLLAVFAFFAFFNYLYAIASFRAPRLARRAPTGRRVAVVVVSFNERHVLGATIEACARLTYPNRLVVLADDSTDAELIAQHRRLAASFGCTKVPAGSLVEEPVAPDGASEPAIEIWESPGFVLFHRDRNAGFKAGSLRAVEKYLARRGIEFMYLLDAEWHPQADALERTLEVMEADDRVAFVQTKRISSREGMNPFQKAIALVEEGCYYVDLAGREALGHPALFSGSCTLIRLAAAASVGGFTPGHLTEDLDLSDRLWVAGWRGVYLEDVANYGEVPFCYEDFRKQQERWAAGSARALREHLVPILTTRELGWGQKLSALRQNCYFTSTLFNAFAVVVGFATIAWISLCWDTYAVEWYLYRIGQIRLPLVTLVYLCVLSNFVEPLAMILKTRRFGELLHYPMSFWYAWGALHTYIIGNLKGLAGVRLEWFLTPKFVRGRAGSPARLPRAMRTLNRLTLAVFLAGYFTEGWVFGWFDVFALVWLPAFVLASLG